MPELDPSAWTASDPKKQIIFNGRNPWQKEYNNLGAQAVTRTVGGMSTHWTCATPEFLKRNECGEVFERPVIFEDATADDEEWKLLYNAARSLIGTSEREFEHSIRHNIVLNKLKSYYRDRNQKLQQNREVKPLPLACHRPNGDPGSALGSPYVHWHAADCVFGDMFEKKNKQNSNGTKRGTFVLLTHTRCTRLYLDESLSKPSVKLAEVKDLLQAQLGSGISKTDYVILAKARI
ncbi:hypothetical protein C0993_003834 [Termitomyces sp. T159_Od127]|nr:hypothetical protein C0993_003834 [Termitomyces sp. T159_Od127]